MLWIKAFHIIAIVAWFAALFYLPRLYVYHAQADDRLSLERFKVMERKLYRGIMTPAAMLVLVTGGALLVDSWSVFKSMGWIHAKLLLVACLFAYHGYCGRLRKDFMHDKNRHGHVFYRWLNEAPVILLVAVVVLVVVKPF